MDNLLQNVDVFEEWYKAFCNKVRQNMMWL